MGGIGNIVSGFVKNIAPKILQAVAPKALEMLKGITDGFVSKGADFLKGAVASLGLPSPLAKLADKLIGKGADMLKNLGGGFLEKGLSKLMEMFTGRNIGGQNVNIPGLTTPARQEAIANNPPTGSNSGAATGSGPSSGSGASSGTAGASGAPNRPPDPAKYEPLSDNKNLQQLMTDRQAYQDARQQMMDSMKFASDLAKAASDTLNAIARNVK